MGNCSNIIWKVKGVLNGFNVLLCSCYVVSRVLLVVTALLYGE